MRILILCTGNSCRSQMAEGFLKSFDPDLEVYSAGTHPSAQVHPKTVEVMRDVNIDLTRHYPKDVDKFVNEDFDYVITVCDSAKERCPVFSGQILNKLHFGFEDSAEASGPEDEIRLFYREIRNEIKMKFEKFYINNIKMK